MKKSEQLLELLRSVEATEPEEIDCDEFLARVAPYLEQLESHETLSVEFGKTAQHLAVCPECREEFDALLRAYEIKLQ